MTTRFSLILREIIFRKILRISIALIDSMFFEKHIIVITYGRK